MGKSKIKSQIIKSNPNHFLVQIKSQSVLLKCQIFEHVQFT